MGLLDGLIWSSPNKELEEAKKELASLKSRIKQLENEVADLLQKNVTLIDKTHGFIDHLKLLVSTLEDEFVVERCWALLNQALSITKGGIFKRTETCFKAEVSCGFRDEPPEIPLDEESMIVFSANEGAALSLSRIRSQDDLTYLERRGAIPDAKLVCPAKVGGVSTLVIVICQYGGNVFRSEDDLDIIQMVGTILGLVITNTATLSEQKQLLDKQQHELTRIRSLFSSMVAPEVIEFIERNPGGIVLGGKRQPVAVMFADIRDFTRLSEKYSPEKIIELLNKFFSLVTDVVIKTRGTLDKFMGDAAMVLYGTPVALENPALTAVRAAIQIQKLLATSMKLWQEEGFLNFGVGIGINFQNVVVGNVGSNRLSNFTAIGDGVNLAHRLCSIAKPGEILISTPCYEALGSWSVPVEIRHGIKVKGKPDPITIYAIMEAGEESVICPKCSSDVVAQKRFCGKCGHKMF